MENHFLIPQSEFEELKTNLQEIKALCQSIKDKPRPLHDWISETEAQNLLGLKETSMWALRKKRKLVFSKVGSRVFYSIKSIQELLNKNQY